MSVNIAPTAVSRLGSGARRESLDHSRLESGPRVGGQNRVTLLGRERVEVRSEDVVLHAQRGMSCSLRGVGEHDRRSARSPVRSRLLTPASMAAAAGSVNWPMRDW